MGQPRVGLRMFSFGGPRRKKNTHHQERPDSNLNVVDYSLTLLIDAEGAVISYVAICDLPKFITARARNCDGVSDRRLSSRLHHMSGHSSRLVVRERANRIFTIRMQHVSINPNLKCQ